MLATRTSLNTEYDPQRILSTLLQHDRISLPQIARLSSLSARHVKNGLAVLIQHNLIRFYPPGPPRATFYEPDISNVYNLVRLAKNVELVEKRLGSKAGELVSTLQVLGFAELEELSFTSTDATANGELVNGNLVNGEHHGAQTPHFPNGDLHEDTPGASNPRHTRTPSEVKGLQDSEFLEDVRDISFIPQADFRMIMEDLVKLEHEKFRGPINGPKKQAEFNALVMEKKRKIVEDGESIDVPEFASNKYDPTNEESSKEELVEDQEKSTVPGSKADEPAKAGSKRKIKVVLDDEEEEESQPQESNDKEQEKTPPTKKSKVDNKKDTAKKNPRKRKAAAAEEQEEMAKQHRAFNKRYWPYAAEPKRPDDDHTPKKLKTDEGSDDRSDDLESARSYVRLNNQKLLVSHRTEVLVDFVARCLGESSAKVFETVLRLLEPNIRQCWNEDDTPDPKSEDKDQDGSDQDDESVQEFDLRVSTEAIVDSLISSSRVALAKDASPVDADASKQRNPDPDVVEVSKEPGDGPAPAAPKPLRNGQHKKNGLTEEAFAAELRRQDTIDNVNHFLRILAEHTHRFVYHASDEKHGEWTVDFEALCKAVIQSEIEKIVTGRFGPVAARIVRILHAKGKLEEKPLVTYALENQRELRAILSQLHEAGFVELMEVPRDGARQREKSVWLWHYEQEGVRQAVLNDTYKAMARQLQRMRAEREGVAIVLEKLERPEVQGREEQYLSRSEKAALARWERTEERLLLQVARLDDLVMVLRDFLPPAIM